MSERRIGWRAAYLLAASGIYLVDQASKAWAVRALRFGQTKTVISNFLIFEYAENPGIAFGGLRESGSFGRWFLVVLAAAAAVAVLFYFFRVPRSDDRVLGACALILAGIVGNLTDRLRLGHVIDFILVDLGFFRWPNFNVADASICIGAVLLAFDMIFSGRSQESGVRNQKDEQKPEAGIQTPE
ncbi:MAG TPA: signal peptidase II [Pyrinomonadaceae bacterium]|jgi:signal peptidase II